MSKLVIECLGFEMGKAYGFQEYLFNLLDYMHRHRAELYYDEVIIVCQFAQMQSFKKYEQSFVIKGLKRAESYWGRLWRQVFLPFSLGLKREDTVFFPGNYSGLIKRCHHVLVIHDLLFKHTELYNNPKVRIQRELFVGPSVKMADVVIGISEYVAHEIGLFYPSSKRKIVPIYNYMNFEKYGGGFSEDDNGYFIAVAANKKHKDIPTIFEAYRRYCEQGGARNLYFIGGINQESEAGVVLRGLPNQVRERIVIHKDKSNNELGELYRHASALISASRFEGFGMPIAEAMYFRLPILLADTAIHREISKNAGLFFPPGDAMKLAELMMNMTSRRIDYGDVISAYDEDKTSAKYVEIFNKLQEGRAI